ncbi:MAG TPA: phosphatase PAP2-related protein [Candidatus Paceibacterota bacterium]|nr:phosphatase PAP2-related protein [Candidatus Paceibacterota bacterium]
MEERGNRAAVALHKCDEPHREIWRRYKAVWAQPGFLSSVLVSLAAFALGWAANYYAIMFSTERASNAVTDILLSNIPVFEVDGFFVYGTVVFAGVALLVLLVHPKRIPFGFKAIALFWIIRSGFTVLTHLAPFESHVMSDFSPRVNDLFFGADLFFSAHTGMPFLGALAFWNEKELRYLFLLGSVYFAAVVLLGHLHYSIDVASAFFITYGIFHIAQYLFPQDWEMFRRDTL